ncbi:hypothetical protein A2U01_0056665, partial [Trifolium medium]|nr:hypothetical protein [Trifolium medium]
DVGAYVLTSVLGVSSLRELSS